MNTTKKQEADQERLSDEAIFKAKQVNRIIENPVHIEYMAKTQAVLFQKFIDCKYKDTDQMQQLHAELTAQRRHEKNYEKVISEGRIAETILERLSNKLKLKVRT